MKTMAAIQAFLHSRRAKNLKPRTIEWYEGFLTPFARFSPKLPMKPEPIEEFLGGIGGEPETRHAYYRCLKALYRFVCKRHRKPNPIELIDPPRCPDKVMPTLEPRETMELLNLADNLRDRALLTLVVDNGARCGEVISLRKQDIKDDSIQVTGKTGQRQIPISDETRRLLLSLASVDASSDCVFTNVREQPLTRHGVYWIVRAYMTKAGIQGPKLGLHRIRHGFGKNYLVNGGDVRSLQAIMGHKHISTTQKYASLSLSDVITKHRKFSPLRAAHAAAQETFFDTDQAVKEAEEILKGGRK